MIRLFAFTVVALLTLAHLGTSQVFRQAVAGRPWWIPLDPD